jgi:hypothetical protein
VEDNSLDKRRMLAKAAGCSLYSALDPSEAGSHAGVHA